MKPLSICCPLSLSLFGCRTQQDPRDMNLWRKYIIAVQMLQSFVMVWSPFPQLVLLPLNSLLSSPFLPFLPFSWDIPDLTSAASFEKVKYWVNELQQHEPNCVLVFCGTKMDLLAEGVPRGTSSDVVEDYASELNVESFETSSKTGENVEALFRAVAESIESPAHDARSNLHFQSPFSVCRNLFNPSLLSPLSSFLLLCGNSSRRHGCSQTEWATPGEVLLISIHAHSCLFSMFLPPSFLSSFSFDSNHLVIDGLLVLSLPATKTGPFLLVLVVLVVLVLFSSSRV